MQGETIAAIGARCIININDIIIQAFGNLFLDCFVYFFIFVVTIFLIHDVNDC